jgi:hypothetical protein
MEEVSLNAGINWERCARHWKFLLLIHFSRRTKPLIRQILEGNCWSDRGMSMDSIEQGCLRTFLKVSRKVD